MTPDTRSTLIGLVASVAVQTGTYLTIGFDPTNPGWWAGLVIAIATAVKGYYHNRGVQGPPTP